MTVGIVLLAGATAVALMVISPLADMRPADRTDRGRHGPPGPARLVFGTLATAVGAATGNLTAARAVPAVTAVIAYVVNGLGPQVSWLAPAQKFSPF